MGFRPHFKAHVSITTHRKMAAIYADDAALAAWLRLGVFMVEKFAGRTEGEMLIREAELCLIANRQRPSAAHAVLQRCARAGLFELRKEHRSYRVIWTKFAEKQGFGDRTQAKRNANPSDPTPTPTPTPKEEKKKKERKSTAPRYVAFPPEGSEERATLRRQLGSWVPKHRARLSCDQIDYVIEVLADWQTPRSRQVVDWYATARGAIRAGWALEGFDPAAVAEQRARRAAHAEAIEIQRTADAERERQVAARQEEFH